MSDAAADLGYLTDEVRDGPTREDVTTPEDVLESAESYRPALVAMTKQTRDRITELAWGFPTRRRVLGWSQEMTVRTLGELPDVYYRELARQMRDLDEQRTLLASLLAPEARERDIADGPAREVRERIVTTIVLPAYHRAFRRLRNDATEYVDDAGIGDEHDPESQRHIAMRPALDELHYWQKKALARCLDGLESKSEIPDWAEDVELATHGEIAEDFAARCYRERSTRRVLCAGSPVAERARELFATVHLLPAFRRGVRTLAGRAGELPETAREPSEAKLV